MRRLVDGEELKKIVMEECEQEGSRVMIAFGKWFCAMVDDMPPVVVEHKQEHWEKRDGCFICSACGGSATFQYCYCPNCGANMCKEDNEE